MVYQDRIIKKLNNARKIIDDAFEMLDEDIQDKCDHFASLVCEIDEAIGEVETFFEEQTECFPDEDDTELRSLYTVPQELLSLDGKRFKRS